MASSRSTHKRYDDLHTGERVGRFNRLKDFVHYGACQDSGGHAPPDSVMYFSTADMRSLQVDLRGSRVVLARGPCLPPRSNFDDYMSVPPMGPILLANMLRAHGASVQIRDLCLWRTRRPEVSSVDWDEEIPRTELAEHLDGRASPRVTQILEALFVGLALDDAAADVVGFSAETEGDFCLSLILSQEIETRYGIPTVIGGQGVVFPIPLLAQCSEAIIVHGEGEIPLLLALDALFNERDLGDVPSLAWVHKGGLQMTHRIIHDLDIRPTYDVTGVPLRGYQSSIEVEGDGPIVPYQYGVGCPFFCGYCNSTSRRSYRLRSPDRIVSDLQNVVRTHGVRRFHMLSHLFNADRQHMGELLDRMEAAKLGIYWSDSCRAAGIDADQLKRMRRVGASTLTWGVDCGSARLLRLMKKGLNLDRVVEILRASHRAGIHNNVNIIFGMPHETDQDIEEALRFMDRAQAYVHEFQTPQYLYDPNSLLARNPERYGLVAGVDGGVDEPDGLSWKERTAKMPAQMRRVKKRVPWRYGYDGYGRVMRLLTGPTISALRKHIPFLS